MAAIPVPPLHRIALIQLAVASVSGLLFFLVDKMLAMSVWVGAVIQLIPQAFFTRAAYRYTGATQTAAILQQFYKGESTKVLLTAAMFALAFIYIKNLSYPMVFLSFIAMMVLHAVCAAKILHGVNGD